jgi:hypothetical protein
LSLETNEENLVPKCVVTIADMQDKESIGASIDNYLSGENYDPNDYVEIIRNGEESIIFTKKNYKQIENISPNRSIKIRLIADFIKNKGKNPLQGMLFE